MPRDVCKISDFHDASLTCGNITQVGGTTFDYDELNRLDEEDPGSATTYTYDATSNRLTRVNGGTTTTTVPAGSNKISAVGGDSYSYDAAGNITDDDTNEYTWNAEGELSVVEVSSSPVGTYTYNAFRQRTKKVAASTVHYVYGAGGLLYGEYDNSGDLIREYVYLNGEPLAQIDTGSPEVLTYLHIDHLGTPKFATNTGGTQVWSWAPDAFGVGSPSGSVTVNLRMAGQYYDSESGIFYNWNRYYNPAIGRFISSDPIGLEGGINTFGYVAQNPVMGIDPYGQFGLIGGAIGGAADLAYQLYKHGGNVACVNWWQVGAVATAGSGVGLLARSGLGALGTLFADSRAFSTISRAFWKARGGAKGWSLDHWAISQKAIRDGLVSPKIGNAGWNLLTMWAPLNRWLGFAQKWGPVQRALARFARGGILFGIPSLSLGAAYFGYEMGMNALNNPCECE